MSNENTNQETFSLGICMAGAVSAGAYTAGVMDYLIEALAEWEKRRGQDGIPKHRVEIPVIGGASAGGMTGIITAAALNNDITPIDKPSEDLLALHPENKLYHAWVDLTDLDMLKRMLDISDIKAGTVLSGLNSSFIDEIAKKIVKIDAINSRVLPPFFTKNLKIFTTLTSLNGLEYNVAFNANTPGMRKYYMQTHNDYACFEITDENKLNIEKKENDPLYSYNDGWIPLNFKENINTDIARDAAMATGAFPVGLKSRILKRNSSYINKLQWLQPATLISPLSKGDHFTLNVDGGLINNEPFEKVRDVLINITGQSIEKDYQDYNTFKSTVLMIEPFPTSKAKEYNSNQNILNVIASTLSSMISQMRSKPSNIQDAMASACAGQYLITPSRRVPQIDGSQIDAQGEAAIACGALDGFSGFLNKEFRVHDYFLGRHNCKIFLRDYFTITEEAMGKNEIFKNGYTGVNKSLYKSTVDNTYQIIPVFSDATDYTFPNMKFSCGKNWPVISENLVNNYEDDIKKRIQAIVLNIGHMNKFKKFLLWIGAKVILNRMLASFALKIIKEQLNKWQLIKFEK